MAREITSRLIAERGFHLVRNAPEINQPVYVVAQMTETALRRPLTTACPSQTFALIPSGKRPRRRLPAVAARRLPALRPRPLRTHRVAHVVPGGLDPAVNRRRLGREHEARQAGVPPGDQAREHRGR